MESFRSNVYCWSLDSGSQSIGRKCQEVIIKLRLKPIYKTVPWHRSWSCHSSINFPYLDFFLAWKTSPLLLRSLYKLLSIVEHLRNVHFLTPFWQHGFSRLTHRWLESWTIASSQRSKSWHSGLHLRHNLHCPNHHCCGCARNIETHEECRSWHWRHSDYPCIGREVPLL